MSFHKNRLDYEIKSNRNSTGGLGHGFWKKTTVPTDPHGSKTDLWLQPDNGNEMSTFVTVGAGRNSAEGIIMQKTVELHETWVPSHDNVEALP